MSYTPVDKKFASILSQTGSTDQLFSVRRTQLVDGPGAGTRLIEVITAGGLRAVFCESRALDLFEAHFRGVNIGFISKNGLASGRVLPLQGDFTPTWPGGLLATCGLRNTGPDCIDDDSYHPLHGLIAGRPAENISVRSEPENGRIIISGQMRESALFGHNLLLKREIEINIFGAEISWRDEVVNQAATPEAVFLLYHFNFGYPFLSPDLQITFPPGEVVPRTGEAEKGLAEYDQIQQPEDGYAEQVFFHYPFPGHSQRQDGAVTVKLHHPGLGITASLSYDAQALPVLTQWKSMKSGDYALGIEPGTSRIRGRKEELEDGYQFILPGYSCWRIPLRLSFA